MRVFAFLVLIAVVLSAGFAGWATWKAEKKAPRIGAYIEVNGVQMHVLDLGADNNKKPPVVLIHGASANLRDMKIALGDVLAADRRVILIDRPGRGYSERPDEGWRLDVQAVQINGVVKSLGLERPIIVGQSFGGAVALAYALQYQDEMAGLVLLAPVSHKWPGGVAWYNGVSETPVAGFLLRRFVIPIYGQLVANKGVDDSFAPNTPPDNYVEQSGLALLFRPRDFQSNASDLAHLKQQIIAQQERYQELKLPVAVITGAADTTVSPEIHSKALERQINGATLTLLPDTGHALHHARSSFIISAIDNLAASAMPPAP